METEKMKITDIDWVRVFLWSFSVAVIAALGNVVVSELDLQTVIVTFAIAFVLSVANEIQRVIKDIDNPPKNDGGLMSLDNSEKPKRKTRLKPLHPEKITSKIFFIPFLE